ncbi:MAG: hypothetical protein LBT48_08655 [Prevotellaceae bacterium]|jgi:hypothetical protein|nr:hypothetical protein [Prevotellaceae bacterium]
MESNLVSDTAFLYPKDCVNLTIQFFSKEFLEFELIKSGYYTGYWWIEYINEKEDIIIYFDGDIGGHFYVDITISNTKYSLWQFDRSVNQATYSCKKNILYQLNVLKLFIK